MDSIIENINNPSPIILHDEIEVWICSLKPLLISHDYLYTFPIKMTSELKKLIKENYD